MTLCLLTGGQAQAVGGQVGRSGAFPDALRPTLQRQVAVEPASTPAANDESPPDVWLFPDAEDTWDAGGIVWFLPYDARPRHIEVTVYGDRDSVLWRGRPSLSQFDELQLPPKPFDDLNNGRYDAVVAFKGDVYDFVLEVRHDYSALLTHEGEPVAYEPCRELRWYYDDNREPTSNKGSVPREFASVAQEMMEATGVRFTRSKGRSNADLVISWKEFRGGGPSATGGSSFSWRHGDEDAYLSYGHIDLNRSDTWARGQSESPRTSLLLHELGHVMGLGHVDVKERLMYPVYSEGSPDHFTRPERKGLRELYKPASCPRAP